MKRRDSRLKDLCLSLTLIHPRSTPSPQLISENKTYYLTAESPSLLEEWIRVLQSLLKVQVTGPPALRPGGTKPTVKGWLTKVQSGLAREVMEARHGSARDGGLCLRTAYPVAPQARSEQTK